MRNGGSARLLCVLLAFCRNDVADSTAFGSNMHVPGYDPATRQIKHYPVRSELLVRDPYRNPRVKVTINSFSDFLNFPRTANLTDFHFIPIANTGHGMTLTMCRTPSEVNGEIDRIVDQLPEDVRNVTFYQRKDTHQNRFPHHNVHTGPFATSHPAPHQNFFRHV